MVMAQAQRRDLAGEFQSTLREIFSLAMETRKPFSPELVAEFEEEGQKSRHTRTGASSESSPLRNLIFRRSSNDPFRQVPVASAQAEQAASGLIRLLDGPVNSVNFRSWITGGR